MQDVKGIFEWARANGEAKIIDRILVRLLPEMVRLDQKITAQRVEDAERLEVSDELYARILAVAQEMVGQDYPGGRSHV
jgi:hypothetical protein